MRVDIIPELSEIWKPEPLQPLSESEILQFWEILESGIKKNSHKMVEIFTQNLKIDIQLEVVLRSKKAPCDNVKL